ncbi:Phosphate starvation-inducible protein psiH [Pantoea agglomerans]|uniref:Phosphate starvation-inducible protein psiH n=1 Tax=Enterobacter agglomerans TaxID=549 RepID=A0A379AEL8_ENTAG|nr:Phosphate starvation-inducible protein psiH [Pantoea agglomerans]
MTQEVIVSVKKSRSLSLVHMSGLDAIGMARDTRDRLPIEARNEAQAHYLNAIGEKTADLRNR